MGVTADGWLDWATKLYGNPNNVNGGVNPVRGIFLHSAEGYQSVLLDPNSKYGYHGDLSWHLTNLMDGRVFQHFPLTAQCWHATAANNNYVGMENEGYAPNEKSLNAAQIANAKRVIADIAAWKGWTPKRPTSPTDISMTLWEHNEVVRIGGTSTSCPSGRIPWGKILGGNMATEHYANELNDRRARELLAYHVMNTLQIKVGFGQSGLVLTGKDGQPVPLACDVPEWAAPN